MWAFLLDTAPWCLLPRASVVARCLLHFCHLFLLLFPSVPTRCDSWSNSLEQTSCDDVFVECLPPLPSSNLGQPLRPGNGALEGPRSRPLAARLWSRESYRPHWDHLSLLETSFSPTMKVDTHPGPRAFGMNELNLLSSTPPPRPPKPSHLSERRPDEQAFWGRRDGLARPSCTMLPRRISVSGSDHVRTWKGKGHMATLRVSAPVAGVMSFRGALGIKVSCQAISILWVWGFFWGGDHT